MQPTALNDLEAGTVEGSKMTENLINRAVALLAFFSQMDAVSHLVEAGENPGDAFLAVSAANILLRDAK